MCGRMGIPITASIVNIGVILKTDDLRLPLNHLQRETLIRMPCDVTWIELFSQNVSRCWIKNQSYSAEARRLDCQLSKPAPTNPHQEALLCHGGERRQSAKQFH